MRARLKVWIECEDGHVALSDWRVALLEAVERRGSLVAAAREVGVPHRTAWERVREMEDRLGCKLLAATSGGTAGGASYLTPEAKRLVQRFQDLRVGFDELLAERFHATFDA